MLAGYLEDFMAFFFPRIHRAIDWTARPRFLDKELQRIIPESKRGRTIVDKLVEVRLRTGQRRWLLIHVEVEDEPRRGFGLRMFELNARLQLHHGRDVISLAVVTGRRKALEGLYDGRVLGLGPVFRFAVAMVQHRARDMKKLKDDPNPFAVVALAHLKKKALWRKGKRVEAKLWVARELASRGKKQRGIMALNKFLDWVMALCPVEERKYKTDLERLEGRKSMPYMTFWEIEGMRKGWKKGLEQGLREAIRMGLRLRFPKGGARLQGAVKKVSGVMRLRALNRAVVAAPSLAKFEEALARLAAPRKNGAKGRAVSRRK